MRKMRRAGKLRLGMPFIIFLTLAFAASMGASYFFLKGKFSFDSPFMEDIESRQTSAKQARRTEEPVRLYESGGNVRSGEWEISADALHGAENAIRKFMQTYKVRLLDLYVDSEGVVYVDLGPELRRDFRGDASEELGILSGLYRTVREAVPQVTALKVLIDGHEAETIGGHIDISRPLGESIAENI